MDKMLGAWNSPITEEHLLGAKKYYQLLSTPEGIHCVQGNPGEKGRTDIIRITDDGTATPLLPPEYATRSKVHEFGGASVCYKDEKLYFVNKDTQNIHSLQDGSVTQVIDDPGMRYADLHPHPTKPWIVCVQEEHTHEPDVINTIALIHLEEKNESQVLHAGHDFYARPRFSKDGKKIAFIAWNFPHMPWEESFLYEAQVKDDGTIEKIECIAGGKGTSVEQILYSDAGDLFYTHDASLFWELYRNGTQITSASIDFGYPHWVFGIERIMQKDADTLYLVGTKQMIDSLYELNIQSGELTRIDVDVTMIGSIEMHAGTLYLVCSSPTSPLGLRKLTRSTLEDVYLFETIPLEEDSISVGKLMSYSTKEYGEAFGFYYPPKLHGQTIGDKPPLLLRVHGGPTGHVSNNFKITTQYFTTRGFAVFDINHSGSTGNGKEFRERLDGNWGILDPIEACAAATMLVEKGLAHKEMLCICGGSAGGFTALNSLTFHDVFTCAISLYGICDLEMLTKETHKFEQKMLDRLVAPYPEKKEVYHDRSSLLHADRITKPLLIIQGTEDTIVPQNQSEKLYSALLEREVPVAFILFEGEGHGIRKGENITRMYSSMLSFMQRMFKIQTDDSSSDIHIDNIDDY